MTSKARTAGKSVLGGIATAEAGAHRAVRKGAAHAMSVTRKGTRWAAGKEASATRELGKIARVPWKALAAFGAAAVALGALLIRRH